MPGSSAMDDMPVFLHLTVAGFLSGESLLDAGCTSRLFREAYFSDSVWKARLRADFGVDRFCGPDLYRRLYLDIVEERLFEDNSVAMGH
eukprot:CAMPEP_0172606928 /NCGR_PEP_ID=MMETSP1068-20121228/27143_1 /TAXON_ID=35684 /ORGANISM="Pseudopedinella elastica, Strain CCMP716" /LENGTH=88 /DNA_ID=CAMNT_0013409807 /DNA_START=37 /DNA_END=303 /DNA_ORIENTATION=+